jgi:DNA-binding transcriptional ArsR family regulator
MPTASDQRTLDVLKVLGSPLRLALLVQLLNHPDSVQKLAEAIGAKPSNVSIQLGILKHVGLVKSVESGSKVIYSIVGPEVKQLIDLILGLKIGIVVVSVF